MVARSTRSPARADAQLTQGSAEALFQLNFRSCGLAGCLRAPVAITRPPGGKWSSGRSRLGDAGRCAGVSTRTAGGGLHICPGGGPMKPNLVAARAARPLVLTLAVMLLAGSGSGAASLAKDRATVATAGSPARWSRRLPSRRWPYRHQHPAGDRSQHVLRRRHRGSAVNLVRRGRNNGWRGSAVFVRGTASGAEGGDATVPCLLGDAVVGDSPVELEHGHPVDERPRRSCSGGCARRAQ